MSKIGQLTRGLKWYNFRNLEGVLNPEIADDPAKMEEVNAYLDFIKDRDKDKVHNIFLKWITLDLQNPTHKIKKMAEVAKELDDPKLLTKSKGKV